MQVHVKGFKMRFGEAHKTEKEYYTKHEMDCVISLIVQGYPSGLSETKHFVTLETVAVAQNKQ